jgi:hypothetical protein
MITYFLKESGIFHVNFSGTVSLEDIKAYLLEFETLENLPTDFLSLYDLRGADMNLKAEDIACISELTEKVTASYKSVKTAFLVDKPKLTAYTFLFSVDHNSEKLTRQVFSTQEVALKWLIG